jgi:Anti-sigma factor NepR
MTKPGSPKGTKMTVDDTAFDPIAAALKQMHHAVTSEELPDDFLRILEDIDAKIAADKSKQ